MLQVTDYHSKNASNPYHSSLLEVTYTSFVNILRSFFVVPLLQLLQDHLGQHSRQVHGL